MEKCPRCKQDWDKAELVVKKCFNCSCFYDKVSQAFALYLSPDSNNQVIWDLQMRVYFYVSPRMDLGKEIDLPWLSFDTPLPQIETLINFS